MLLALAGAAAGQQAAPAKVYQGRVVELLTERPIEGALVLVGWEAIVPSQGGEVLYALRELLTDATGAFRVEAGAIEAAAPPTALRPGLIVYKPGYVTVPRERSAPEFGIPVASLEARRGVIALKPVRDLEERSEAYNSFVAQTKRLQGDLGGGTLDQTQRLWREELVYLVRELGGWVPGMPKKPDPSGTQP